MDPRVQGDKAQIRFWDGHLQLLQKQLPKRSEKCPKGFSEEVVAF